MAVAIIIGTVLINRVYHATIKKGTQTVGFDRQFKEWFVCFFISMFICAQIFGGH